MELLTFATQRITAYGFNKGLDSFFADKEDFASRLSRIISSTIDEFQSRNPVLVQGKKFPFYKSQILLEEFLKFRLFSKGGYKIDEESLQNAFEQNPNILKPTEAELELFFQIFDEFISNDEKIKKLEIEAFHKEVIFDVYEKVEGILNTLQVQLIEIVPLLEDEYMAEINSYVEELKDLRPRTALKHLQNLEKRVNQNVKHVSSKVQAQLKYFIGTCFEAIGNSNEAFEHFIKAYKLVPENIQYTGKACISYYLLGDEKYKKLKEKIEENDDFNIFCWVIETFEADNTLGFIKKAIPPIVVDKKHFKRLVFNHNLKRNKVDSLELISVLGMATISQEFPSGINYDNLHHWIFILNILSIQFFSNTEIPFLGFLEKNEKSIQFLELSKLLSEVIEGSELNDAYNVIVFYYYWLQSEINIQKDILQNLKATYDSLKEKDSFQTLLLASAIYKHDNIQNAIEIIDNFEGELDEHLISLKTFYQLDNLETDENILDYFRCVTHINELNIQNVCSFLIPVIKTNVIEKHKLQQILSNVQFSVESYRDLMTLLVDSLYIKDSCIEISKIYQVQKKLTKEPKLFLFIAILYFENKYFDECIKFQESYIDEEKESRDLLLFIRALDASKNSNQLKLLRLLKKWRTSYAFNDYLLRIEIELRQIIKDWKEINDITKYGLSRLPNDESFYTLYIMSFLYNNKTSEIGEELAQIEKFSFSLTENALRVVNVLFQSGYYETALKIIYKKAVDKTDSLARINYFSLPANLPSEYFIDYDDVHDNCYVKFEIDGEVKMIHVNSDTITSPIVQKSIGKKVLQTFTIEKPFSKKFKNVRILRIMNKYLALYEDILIEVHSSFSNLPVESLNFDPDDIESFEKQLIENFSPDEIERRKQIEKNFEEFQNYGLSFTELTNANFNGSFIDSYYHLISTQSKGFFIKPLKYINKFIKFQNKKLVIDFSSGLLFYELELKLGLVFDKFIISDNVYGIIEDIILKTESLRKSKMSVSLFQKEVVPHFYPEGFHDKRLEFIKDIKKWFQNNTVSITPEEKIDLVRPLYDEGKITKVFDYLIDNALLAQRKDHILITDDFVYEKILKTKNSSTTENYLVNIFPDRKNEILETMLSFKYIGITVNSDLLYSTYINHYKEGYSYIYSYALRNISLKINFDPLNIVIVVDYLKKLAFNPIFTKEKYKYVAVNVLAILISSFPNPSISYSLKTEIEKKFHLMGDYLNITLSSLLDAFRINTSNKN